MCIVIKRPPQDFITKKISSHTITDMRKQRSRHYCQIYILLIQIDIFIQSWEINGLYFQVRKLFHSH